jgi:NAD-dependent DNA ligase
MLTNRKVTTTGTFDISPDEIKDLVTRLNGTYTDSIKEADCLLVGEDPGSKLAIAMAKKIQVLDYSKLQKELNV